METDYTRLHHHSDKVRWLPNFSKWLAMAGGYVTTLAAVSYYDEYTHPLPYDSQPGRVMLVGAAVTVLGIATNVRSKRSLHNADAAIKSRFEKIMLYSAHELQNRWPIDQPESTAGSE